MRGTTREAATPRADWRRLHFDALREPGKAERPIVLVMEAVVLFSEDLGNDVVLGQGIVQLLLGLRLLLNGDTGRLDCGSVDSFIRHYIALHNFEPDKEVLNDG